MGGERIAVDHHRAGSPGVGHGCRVMHIRRSEIAEALLESLEGESGDGATEAWAEEIMKRITRNAPGIPAE